MLKIRVIPVLLYDGYILVKTVRFLMPRNIGVPVQSARVFNSREVDELIFLDINATKENRDIDLEIVREVALECFMPLTIGGGVRSVDGIRQLLKAGADKVAINSQAIKRPSFIKEASNIFGAQCIVVSIDAKKIGDGMYEVYSEGGKKPTGLDVVDWAKRVGVLGAGEILLNSIDNDGVMRGYDLELIRLVSNAVSIPVIACGGAGKLQDFVDAVKVGGTSAVAAASIFQYTQTTPMNIKEHMAKEGIPTRIQ